MRILMTADTYSSIWTYALELTQALQPYGIHVHLATMGEPPSSDQWRDAHIISNLTVHPSSFRLEWMDDAWIDVWAAGDWLQDLAAEIKPDLIHLNHYSHATLNWRVPVIVAAHSCKLGWWNAVKGGDMPETWSQYRQTVAQGLRSASAVVTSTYSTLRCLDRMYGTILDGSVIPYTRTNPAFKPTDKWDFVFCSGRMVDETVNLPMMTAIAADTDLPVLIAGDTRATQRTYDQTMRAHLLGQISERETAYWLGRARIYAHPAYYEPFGFSILEAAQSGCALLLSNLDNLRELWEGAAIFLPPDDPDAWVHTIDQLADHPSRAATWGNAALQRARQFSADRMAEGYLSVYASLRLTDERHHIPLAQTRAFASLASSSISVPAHAPAHALTFNG